MSQIPKTDLLLELMKLSISAHNAQPFKLKVHPDRYEIVEDSTRHLTVADPHGRDMKIGLGALLETFDIGLSGHQLKMNLMGTNFFTLIDDKEMKQDVLEKELTKRFSYRGKFKAAVGVPKEVDCGHGTKLKFLSEIVNISEVAKAFDKVNYKFLSSPGYIEELYSWMRFNKSHPRWGLDGLNTESMSLTAIEAMGASQVLKPFLFKALAAFGIAAPIISEAPIIKSCSAVVAITGVGKNPVDIGRGFMRGWLTLTSLNLYGAPLSLLTDDAESLTHMRNLFEVKPNETLYNVLRVGTLPEGYQMPARARLSSEDLYA